MSPPRKNNGKDFSNKEVYLRLITELDEKIDKMNGYLQKHVDWCISMTDRYIPEFNKQTEALAQVCKELPDKGFCGKVDKMYQDMYPSPDTGEPGLPQKVNILWNDRRWMKGILYALIGLGVFNAFVTWFHV